MSLMTFNVVGEQFWSSSEGHLQGNGQVQS
uniref:Uncharacterized protein n=1 Tax=Anguilla anguilla TaxID=7936 RepID=A0A0E9RP94_ANGAN